MHYVIAISNHIVIEQSVCIICGIINYYYRKEITPHRQVDMGIVVTSRKPMWCNCSTLAWNARERCGFDSYSRHNIVHFHHTHNTRQILILQIYSTLLSVCPQ